MTTLDTLKNAQTLSDLARILGYSPKGLSFNLFHLDDSEKYRIFHIPKKQGGKREIKAPNDKIKLIQSKLACLLDDCVEEIQKTDRYFLSAAHAFCKKKTIISNATKHKRRRYVFNIDLEDFFGTINFGRVRGFFIKDKHFQFHPDVATVIAQIACHDNALPQGSPCSPVISNLVGNILDRRISALARNSKCVYTRYADDLTFSTNVKEFPPDIAVCAEDLKWSAGGLLVKTIEKSGFKINAAKSRMNLHHSRQTVTGIVVNVKPNINQDYYKMVRSMCHSLFTTGQYYYPKGNNIDDEEKRIIKSLNPLEGMLSHIYFVKMRRDLRKEKSYKVIKECEEKKKNSGYQNLYKKFLYYKHFVNLSKPLIITEGKTDIIYLKCAIHSLAKSFPLLANIDKDGKIEECIHFLNRSDMSIEIMGIAGGTTGQVEFINSYSSKMSKFKYQPTKHPIIVIFDNDKGTKAFDKMKKDICAINSNPDINYYSKSKNIYLVGIPKEASKIEDLFPYDVLNYEINGKKFNSSNKSNLNKNNYSKTILANKVVRPNCNTIDFLNFQSLLERIEIAINHFYDNVS